jgi:hypothetical protein
MGVLWCDLGKSFISFLGGVRCIGRLCIKRLKE